MISRVVARFSAGAFQLYALSRHQVGTPLTPAVTIQRPVQGDKPHGFAGHPGLDGVAYTTETEVVRLGATGDVRWRLSTGSPATTSHNGRVCCAFASGGDLLWVYLPEVMIGRGAKDRLLVVDASGAVVAGLDVPSVGHGASMREHADGHMIIEIGEGQDGVVLLRCRLDGDQVVAEEYPWSDRILIDVSPDGYTLMTVDHELQEDVAFHAYPGGEVLFSLTAADFGEEREEAMVEWAGGYLDARTAVVVLYGEDEETEQEWHSHHLVDLGSRAPAGRWPVESAEATDIEPLGDGTWLQLAAGGGLERRSTTP